MGNEHYPELKECLECGKLHPVLEETDATCPSKRKPTGLRRVRILKEREETQGFFHGWGQDYEEFEVGPGNYSVGIVELDDGCVRLVYAPLVEFLDGTDLDNS